MNIISRLLLSTVLLFTSVSLYAVDLITVYNDALQNDQIFQQAQATLLDNKEILPQARSALLPQLVVSGATTTNQEKTTMSTQGYPDQVQNTTPLLYNYGLNLTQALFNAGAMYAYGSAKSTVAQAMATFSFATQDLVLRTAQAYFGVLKAEQNLQAAVAQTKALESQLEVAKQRYQVGLDPITAFEQAKAAYHAAVSTELANRNALFDAGEDLRVITNKQYSQLAQLKPNFQTVAPEPNDIEKWSQAGIEKNLNLKAARYGMLAAEDLIKAQQGNRLPSISLIGGYNTVETQQPLLSGGGPNTTIVTNTASIGVQGNFNLYTGGNASSLVRQAKASYLLANAVLEQSYRTTIASTRKDFRGVMIGISQIEADRDAITASLAALRSAEAGYKVGTQIFTTVLQQQQLLYQAQTTYATDSFNYLISTLQLKEDVGTLSKDDLIAINAWLEEAATH